MRVIITGGTGLIGRALTDSLVADEHEVIVLSRNPGRAVGLPPRARAVAWDARTAAGWGELVEGAEAIVNLAGESLSGTRWTAERKRRIRDSRRDAGRAVVQAIESSAHKPAVVIQTAGIGIYGSHDDEILTEADQPGQGFLESVAVEWEASTAAVEGLGVRHVVIRNGLVTSLKGGYFPRTLLPFKFLVGGPLGTGRQWWPWIHIADEIAAIRYLLAHEEARGPFNVSAPNPVTNAEFARTLGRVLRRPAIVPVPAFALRLLFGEMADLLLYGQRAVPQRLTDIGFTFTFPQLEGALQDLFR